MRKGRDETHVSVITPGTRSLLVLSCFFLSGVSGLIYEVIWVRMIDKVLGSAPFAVATVLTVFMLGLALGSYLAGRRVDRIPGRRALLTLYGKLEVGIGVYGLLIPLFVVLVKPLYALAYNHLFQSFFLYTFLTFLGCLALLLLPTALMGATLPILCRYYVTHLDHLGTRAGRLYGLNTVGAAAGAFLTGFFLIKAVGVWNTIFVAAGINFLVGFSCILFGRETERSRRDAPRKRPGGTPDVPGKGAFPASRESSENVGRTWALWIFAVSGFCAMAYEVIWTRLLGLIIGPTTYSFTMVVATFIVGLAAGSLLFGWIGDRVRGVFAWLAGTQLAAASLALLVSQFLGNSQFFFAKVIYTFQHHFGEMMTVQACIAFLTLLGPTLLLGAAFPLVNKIFARALPQIGRSVGTAYAFNTVGAILGSFVAGFVLLPAMGKESSLKFIGLLQFAFALISLGAWLIRARPRPAAWLALTATGLLGAGLFVAFPSWNRQLLSYGRYHNFREMIPDFTRTSWIESVARGPRILLRYETGRKVVFYGDGISGFTTVEKLTDSLGNVKYTLLNSGKPDASSHGDRSTQTLLAHVPLLFHPHPETVMVLGLASGMTAGEVLHYPVKELDVLEINREVIKACEIFTPWNNHCLTDPRTSIILQDGRNHLSLTRKTYDVIISEPSNPWMAGLANLYTLEFFQTVKNRLREKGIFVQWIHSYEMNWSTLAMIGRTFATVFPDGLLMTTLTGAGDYLLIGFKGKGTLSLNTALKNFPYARRSENMRLPDPRLLYHLILTEDLKDLFGAGPLHTDNRPRLEFAAPKLLYWNDTSIDRIIAEKRSISTQTRDILEATSTSNSLLDLLDFSASVFSPLFNLLDPEKLPSPLRDRYDEILGGYCSRVPVPDYGVIPNNLARESCAREQAAAISRHLTAAPDDGPAYYSLGLALLETGEKEKAIEAFQKTLHLDPYNAKAYNNLGLSFMEKGDLSKAEEAFQSALSIDPTHASAYFNLAQVSLRRGERDKAMTSLRRGLKYQDNPTAKNLLRQLLLSD